MHLDNDLGTVLLREPCKFRFWIASHLTGGLEDARLR